MSKVTKIDVALGKAFVSGENLDLRGEYTVQSYDIGSQIYVGHTPIMWFNKHGRYLRFSLNKQDTTQVRSRLNGLLQYLYEISTLDHVYKFVVRKRQMRLVVDNTEWFYFLDNDTIMTVLPVHALNVPNEGTHLFLSSPDEAMKMNIEKGVFVARPKESKEPTQEAAFLTFDDLSGVC